MAAGPLSVHIDLRHLIHRSKMQDEPSSFPVKRIFKNSSIPQAFIGHELPSHSGEQSFRRKGHKDHPVKAHGFPALLSAPHGIFPEAVQIDVGAPDHLRPRVFPKHIVRIKRLAPWCVHFFMLDLLFSELEGRERFSNLHIYLTGN